MGQSSVTKKSKSMSSDCSNTWVPTTMSLSRSAAVERFPNRSNKIRSLSARSGMRNWAWNRNT